MTRFVFWWTVLAKGKWDGIRGLPMATHFRLHECGLRLSFFESQIIDIAEITIRKLCEEWRRTKERLDGQCKAARYELLQLLGEAQANHSRHIEKGLEYPHSEIALPVYVGYMLITAVAELVFNYAAMRILRLQPYEGYLIALGPSAVVVIAAHLTGKKIRQWTKGDSMFTRGGILILVAIGCKVLAVASVSELRNEYLTYLGTAVSPHAGWALIGLNCVFICGGVFASYLGHDSDADIERICGQKRALIKRIRTVWGKWNELSGDYDLARTTTRERILAVRDDAKVKCDEYRRGVSSTILGGLIPDFFQEVITDRFFRPLDNALDEELDSPPPSIDDVLNDLGITTPSNRPVKQDRQSIPFEVPEMERSVVLPSRSTNGHRRR